MPLLSKKIPPIVMLHHVSDDPSLDSLKPYSINCKAFLQLVNYLDTHNFQTITFTDIAEHHSDLQNGKKKVLLTFDDCPRHLFDFAIPELLKRKMKASFYMPTAHLDSYNSWDVAQGRSRVDLMNEKDLQVLNQLGMEVGAHSHHHIHLKKLNSDEEVKAEVVTCKNILEEILGRQVYSFAYPFASVPKNYRNILTDAGYHFACSIYQPFENDFALRRFIYHDGDTPDTLRKKLSWQYKYYRKLTDPLKAY